MGAAIAADLFRAQWTALVGVRVPPWALWSTAFVVVLVILWRGRDVSVMVDDAPWIDLVGQRRWQDALDALVGRIKEDPDRHVALFLEVAEIYALDEVALPESALVWLDALIEREDEPELAARALLRRAQLFVWSFADPRRAAIDLLTIRKRHPSASAFAEAVELHQRVRGELATRVVT